MFCLEWKSLMKFEKNLNLNHPNFAHVFKDSFYLWTRYEWMNFTEYRTILYSRRKQRTDWSMDFKIGLKIRWQWHCSLIPASPRLHFYLDNWKIFSLRSVCTRHDQMTQDWRGRDAGVAWELICTVVPQWGGAVAVTQQWGTYDTVVLAAIWSRPKKLKMI